MSEYQLISLRGFVARVFLAAFIYVSDLVEAHCVLKKCRREIRDHHFQSQEYQRPFLLLIDLDCGLFLKQPWYVLLHGCIGSNEVVWVYRWALVWCVYTRNMHGIAA